MILLKSLWGFDSLTPGQTLKYYSKKDLTINQVGAIILVLKVIKQSCLVTRFFKKLSDYF